MTAPERLLITAVVDVPAACVPAYWEYEDRVLPLLARHDGRLERRLRTQDNRVEVHVLSFGSRDGYVAYLADPRRLAAHRTTLNDVHLQQRVLEVHDVPVAGPGG